MKCFTLFIFCDLNQKGIMKGRGRNKDAKEEVGEKSKLTNRKVKGNANFNRLDLVGTELLSQTFLALLFYSPNSFREINSIL